MKIYYCDICKYDAKQKSNYEKHIKTKVHEKMLENHVMKEYYIKSMVEKEKEKEKEKPKITHSGKRFKCEYCDKSYKYRQGLSEHHRRSCKQKKYYDMDSLTDNILDNIKYVCEKEDSKHHNAVDDIYNDVMSLKQNILLFTKNHIFEDP